jgi:hypothetical protein
LLTKLPSLQVLLAPTANLPESLDERSHRLLSRLQKPMRLAELIACGRMPEYDVYEIVAAAIEAGYTHILESPGVSDEPEGSETRRGSDALQGLGAPSGAESSGDWDKPPIAEAALSDPTTGSKALFTPEPAWGDDDDEPDTAPAAKKPRPSHGLRRQPRNTLVYWCLVALIAGVAAWGFATGRARGVRVQENFETHEAREELIREIEVYRALMGRYPETLEDLSRANLAGAGLIERACVAEYRAGARGRTYQIEHAPHRRTVPGSGSSYR